MTQFKYWFLRFDNKKIAQWNLRTNERKRIKKSREIISYDSYYLLQIFSWNRIHQIWKTWHKSEIPKSISLSTTWPKSEIPKSISLSTKQIKFLTPLKQWFGCWMPLFWQWLCHQFFRWSCRVSHWNQRWFLKWFWSSFGYWFGTKSFSNVTKLGSSTIKPFICGGYPVLMGIKSDDLITLILSVNMLLVQK